MQHSSNNSHVWNDWVGFCANDDFNDKKRSFINYLIIQPHLIIVYDQAFDYTSLVVKFTL